MHPHERDTDDAAALLGGGLEVSGNYQQQHNESIEMSMSDKNRKDCRARLARIAKYWEEKQNDYFKVGVRKVSEEHLNDESKFYFGKHKLDLVYTGLDYKFILDFLMNTKFKDNGKLKSNQDIRKYKDAILWGAKTAKQRLPTTFYEEIDKYLASYKKLVVSEKKKGNVDETAADPITATLYQAILTWAMEGNNIFVWFWTLAQWNCMARCASIDPLAFHNFKMGQDSLICKYDDQKADKVGEKLSEKNIYANPFDWTMCFWTGFGIYTAVNCCALASHERIFLKESVKEGAASKRYSEQLLTLVDKHPDEMMAQVRPAHFNPYGLRKGSATHAVSGTTLPPSLPSMARRGEWSQGSVLDVYWHFASIGDHYLGRILAGLKPNEAGFATLPPHFNISNPLENSDVRQAMQMMYEPIIKNYEHQPNNPTAILLRCLACIVYHADSLVEVMVGCPSHDFAKLSILHEKPLLSRLHLLVTVDATDGVMTTATGIPPHIELANQVQKVLDLTTKLMCCFGDQTNKVIEAVQKAMEDKAWDSGHVTGSRLLEVLNEFQQKSLTSVDQRLVEIRNEFSQQSQQLPHSPTGRTNTQQPTGVAANAFAYNGRYYSVPENFQFPKGKLRDALRFWLLGRTMSANGDQEVKPFRKLTLEMLPTKKLKDAYKLNWKPIFGFLADAINIPNDNNRPTEEEIDAAYSRCLEHLKSTVSYCFEMRKKPEDEWNLATWSLRVARSSIEKRGTDSDKAKLAPATNRNKARSNGLKRNRKDSDNPLYLRRQQQRQRKIRNATNNVRNATNNATTNTTTAAAATGTGTFANVFPLMATTVAMEQRDKAIAQQVAEEMKDEREKARTDRATRGDAVGADGTLLFTAERQGIQAPNLGDNSAVSRQGYTNSLQQHLTARAGTPCVIPGCQWSQLVPDHRCYNSSRCKQRVHNLCAQGNDLCSKDNPLNMFCSKRCMKQREG